MRVSGSPMLRVLWDSLEQPANGTFGHPWLLGNVTDAQALASESVNSSDIELGPCGPA